MVSDGGRVKPLGAKSLQPIKGQGCASPRPLACWGNGFPGWELLLSLICYCLSSVLAWHRAFVTISQVVSASWYLEAPQLDWMLGAPRSTPCSLLSAGPVGLELKQTPERLFLLSLLVLKACKCRWPRLPPIGHTST